MADEETESNICTSGWSNMRVRLRGRTCRPGLPFRSANGLGVYYVFCDIIVLALSL